MSHGRQLSSSPWFPLVPASCDVVDRRLADLSAAEREVFTLVRRGLSNKEIAQARGRSVATVKNQLGSVFQKFGVTSRTRLIAWTR
jgi:DNA-binding CsgD family transcriptional regulator